MSWEHTQQNHRGPYRFLVVRPHRTKGGFYSSQWLPGIVTDVEEEAVALLNDSRDTIHSVWVWSEREAQFTFGFTKGKV